MKKAKYTSKKICIMAIFIAVGIILQYLENRILISPVPGGKLGLGNVVSILNIFMFGGSNAFVISIIRALLGTLLTGGASALPYSLTGAILSTSAMIFIKNFLYPKISMVGMSIIGATLHNLAQICVAAILFSSQYIFSYFPVLLIVALFSGFATGYAAQILGKRVLSSETFK